jgi:hypothetical protein
MSWPLKDLNIKEGVIVSNKYMLSSTLVKIKGTNNERSDKRQQRVHFFKE